MMIGTGGRGGRGEGGLGEGGSGGGGGGGGRGGGGKGGVGGGGGQTCSTGMVQPADGCGDAASAASDDKSR